MAKIIINLPGGLQVEREVSDKPASKASGRPVPAFAPDAPEVKPQKTILEKAAEAVEEVVKPKRRGGRPKKKPETAE